MPKLFNGVVKLTESQYASLKNNGSITVNGTTIDFDENTLYVTDYTIDDELDLNSENPVKNSVITKVLEEKTSNGVTLDTVQTITGNKFFNCNIQKYGVDIATINDIPKLIDSLDSTSSTSALSAKQGKVLNDKISSIVSNSNGRISTFTVQSLSELLGLFDYPMQEGDVGLDSYVVGKSQITYKDKFVDLMTGDIFLIIDKETPDYWFSLEDKTLYQLETRKIDLNLYALKTDIPTTLPASDVYSWAKQLNKPDYDLTEIKNVPDWVKSSTKPTYTAEEVGALSSLPDNVVLVDNVQTIGGAKTFSKVVESGKSTISEKTGFSNIRLITNDSNNVHQTELYVDENGNTKITHKNRTLNSSGDDSYISFNHDKLKYVTGGSEGTTATIEYDIITSKGGELVGPLVVKGGSKTSGVIMIKEQGQIISDEGDYCLLGRLDKTLTAGTTAYPLRLRGSEETFKYNDLDGALRSDNAYQFANNLFEESINIFYIPDVPETTKNGVTYSIKDGVITLNGTATSWINFYSDNNLKIGENGWFGRVFYDSDTLPPGFHIQFQKSDGSEFIQINKDNHIDGLSASVKRERVDIVANQGTVFNNLKVSLLIKNGRDSVDKYYAYNQKRQITNEQATFVQELYDESANIFQIPDVPTTTKNGITYSIKDGVVSISGTCTANTIIFDIYNIETENRGSIKLFNNFPTSAYPYVEFNSWEKSWDNGIYLNSIDRFKGQIYSTARNHVALEIKSGFSGTDIKLMPMITNIQVIPEVFGKFNPNRHITNSEAEFLKEEHEKSLNKFDISKLKSVSGNFSVSGETIVLQDNKFYCGPSAQTLREFADLEIGRSYVLLFNKTNASANNRIYLSSVGIYWNNGTWLTITQDILDSKVAFYGTENSTNTLSKFMISEYDEQYQSYNQNKNITNSQAEFLKEEFEKNTNLYYGKNKIGAISSNNPNVIVGTTNRITTAIYYPVKPNTKYSISFGGLDQVAYTQQASNKIDLSDSGWNASNKVTFTTNSNASYIRFVFRYSDNRVVSSASELTNVMFNEGDPLPYQPYNSSSHITNAQADLLKSEYDKQKNIVDNDDFEKGDLVTHGTVESASDILARTKNFIEVKPNTKYTVSVGANKTEFVGIKTYTSKNLSTGQNLNPREIYTFPYTFTMPDGVNYIKVVIKPLDMTTLNDKQIQIEEGEVATSYHNGEGEIIREANMPQFKLDGTVLTITSGK